MSTLEQAIRKHFKYNLFVNMIDGGFFGLGWGFGSIGTILPLFVSRVTDSALLIGLIPAIHGLAWQFPQLFLANRIARLRRYKPMVMWLTIHERIPYLGFAMVAFFLPALGSTTALILIFLLLLWQGIGSGLTANPWQSMIAKIIPSDWRGTFFGLQAGIANICISLTAIAAGYILERLPNRTDFALTFILAAAGMGLSMIFLGATREPADTEKTIPPRQSLPWREWLDILRRDRNFSAYLIVRFLSSFSTMGFAFYIVYGLRHFGMDEVTAGFLTAALTITSTVANMVMGWLGDRVGHRAMLIAGSIAVTASSLLAWGAPSIAWMYPAFILSGLANVAYWTIGMAITVEFGDEETRPTYIGLANTLVAPATILAPLIGGWIAEATGFQTTFMISAVGGLVIAALLLWLVRDPRSVRHAILQEEE
jgi:MFS family permease